MSDFQASASVQGRQFEQAVEVVLQAAGWVIEQRHAVIEGVEIDLIAEAPDGVRWWIECKGSWKVEKTAGARRGDTVKKAVGIAWYLSTLPERCPYMLITSHMPNDGTVSDRLLRAAETAELFDRISVLAFLEGFTTEEDNGDA